MKERWKLLPSVKVQCDHLIYKKLLQTILLRNPTQKYVAAYWPIENEVDTIALIDSLLLRDVKVCIPYIKKNKMVFKPITSINFEYEYWKSMRQPNTPVEIKGEDIKIMLIPMIGFSDKKKRLGFGFNHYNDYLTAHNKIFTIGLAYALQQSDTFVTTSRDKILDMIITEKRPS